MKVVMMMMMMMMIMMFFILVVLDEVEDFGGFVKFCAED